MYTPPQPGYAPPSDLRFRLRPMGIGDILDTIFRLYRDNVALFIATVAILEVPLQIINLIITFSLLDVTKTSVTTTTTGSGLTDAQQQALIQAGLASAGLGLVLAVISLIFSAMISASLAVVISQRFLNRPITSGQAYRSAVDRLGALVLGLLWIGIRVALMAITIVGIPFAIYFGVAWTLFPQAVMLDGVGGGAASRRSRELIKGFWWKTLGLLIITAILVGVVGLIPSAIVGSIMGTDPSMLVPRTLVSGIVGLIVAVLVAPIQIGSTTLLFYDLKIRKEAFDLEAMARQIGAPM